MPSAPPSTSHRLITAQDRAPCMAPCIVSQSQDTRPCGVGLRMTADGQVACCSCAVLLKGVAPKRKSSLVHDYPLGPQTVGYSVFTCRGPSDGHFPSGKVSLVSAKSTSGTTCPLKMPMYTV